MAASGDQTRGDLERFAALLERAEAGQAARLSLAELRELAHLYRATTARLARLRDRGVDPEATRSLNTLAVRGHALLYASYPAERPRRTALLDALAAAVARAWPALIVAATLLAVSTAIGLSLGLRDPDAVPTLMPAGLGYNEARLDALVHSPEARVRFLAREETPIAHNAFFGSALFAHNSRVALLSFATGLLAAVPTVLLLVYNGLGLGAFASIFLRDPAPVDFLAWLLPHGVPELSAIVAASAGGLVLGAAVVAPGRAGRRIAVQDAAASAAMLLAIALPLLLLAGFMESFVRESVLGTGTRLALAALELLALCGGLLGLRRFSRRVPVDTGWLRELIPAHDGSPDSGSGRRS